MIHLASEQARALSIQLGPGEDVCRAFLDAVRETGVPGAAVVAAIGSLSEASFLLVTTGENGEPAYSDVHRHTGTIELLGLQGHVGWTRSAGPAFHLHGSFGLPSGEVVGGHVLGLTVLVTLQATLLVAADAGWEAVPWGVPEEQVDAAAVMTVFVPTADALPRVEAA